MSTVALPDDVLVQKFSGFEGLEGFHVRIRFLGGSHDALRVL